MKKRKADDDQLSSLSGLSKLKIDYEYIVKHSCIENPTKITLPRI